MKTGVHCGWSERHAQCIQFDVGVQSMLEIIKMPTNQRIRARERKRTNENKNGEMKRYSKWHWPEWIALSVVFSQSVATLADLILLDMKINAISLHESKFCEIDCALCWKPIGTTQRDSIYFIDEKWHREAMFCTLQIMFDMHIILFTYVVLTSNPIILQYKNRSTHNKIFMFSFANNTLETLLLTDSTIRMI